MAWLHRGAMRLMRSTLPLPLQRRLVGLAEEASATTLVARLLRSLRERLESCHERARCVITRPTYIIHVGNSLAVFAMGASDMLQLRGFMIGANACGIAFNLLQPKPMVQPALWGVFFLFGHGIQVYRLLIKDKEVRMTMEEEEIYRNAFMPFGISPRQFAEIIQQAPCSKRHLRRDEFVHRDGTGIVDINYLLEGTLSVDRDCAKIMKMKPGGGAWAGEFWDSKYDVSKDHKWNCSARCIDDHCVTASFNKKQLHDAFVGLGVQGELSADKIQISDLWAKMRSQQSTSKAEMYRMLLMMSVTDGKITAEERSMLEKYRCCHREDVSEADHITYLREVGWTPEEYARGSRAWFAQRPAPRDLFDGLCGEHDHAVHQHACKGAAVYQQPSVGHSPPSASPEEGAARSSIAK